MWWTYLGQYVNVTRSSRHACSAGVAALIISDYLEVRMSKARLRRMYLLVLIATIAILFFVLTVRQGSGYESAAYATAALLFVAFFAGLLYWLARKAVGEDKNSSNGR